MSWLAAALSALLIVAPAGAETVTVGFAPPIDRALLYHIDQQRPMDGRECRFVAERELRFERAADGYVLHVTLRRVEADGPPAASDPFQAALSPLIGVEQRFRVDADGAIMALDNMDEVWRAAETGLGDMMRRFGPETTRHRAARQILALFGTLTVDGRLALLAGELRPLLVFARTPVADGAGRGIETAAGSPLGRPVNVSGHVVMTGRDGDMLSVEEKLSGEGVAVAIQYAVSATSGLVGKQRRRLTMGPQWLTETRSLSPAAP